ncbi:hypothetical protein BDDG_13150, partial [Blastomyces dermatitidis ATCC 18188]
MVEHVLRSATRDTGGMVDPRCNHRKLTLRSSGKDLMREEDMIRKNVRLSDNNAAASDVVRKN